MTDLFGTRGRLTDFGKRTTVLLHGPRYCLVPKCPNRVTSGRCAEHAVQREHERDNFDVRRWYRIKRWKNLRVQVLREEPVCQECTKLGHVRASTKVDHIVKHKGDYDLFFSRANCQGLCAFHHGQKTQRGE